MRLARGNLKEAIQLAEEQRVLNRTWIHIDFDMYYAAATMREKPELREKPLAIGGELMISTSNYIARKWGVRAGMPGFVARGLCEELIIEPCDFKLYNAISKEFKEILREYDERLESMGLDEANLDVTDYLEEHKGYTPESLARHIRERVY